MPVAAEAHDHLSGAQLHAHAIPERDLALAEFDEMEGDHAHSGTDAQKVGEPGGIGDIDGPRRRISLAQDEVAADAQGVEGFVEDVHRSVAGTQMGELCRNVCG